jgi:hypothetical protein
VKCKTYGASRGCLGTSNCGGIFRDHGENFLGGFPESLEISDASSKDFKKLFNPVTITSYAANSGNVTTQSLVLTSSFAKLTLTSSKMTQNVEMHTLIDTK